MRAALVVFLTLFLSNQLFSQETQNNALSGKIIDIIVLYPISSDTQIKQIPKKIIIYPNLVVNNIIIYDTSAINYFRNHFDRTKIAKIKHVSAEKARKMGIMNVSKDGALFVTTKKDYYFDFSDSDTINPGFPH